MLLTEKLKRVFLKQPHEHLKTPDKPLNKIRNDLTADEFTFNYQAYFDNNLGGTFQNNYAIASEQATKINQYRELAKNASVAEALNVIADEITFSNNNFEPLKITAECDDNIVKALEKSFRKIMKLFNPQKNIYRFVRESYIDGQMNILVEYGDESEGITGLSFLDPRFLIFDLETQTYKYIENNWNGQTATNYANYMFYLDKLKMRRRLQDQKRNYDITTQEFNIEEIVHQDFGLYNDNGLILSYLEDSIKTANMLSVLEDLLIPLRYSRSVARRIFNVDVRDLSNSKAEAYMQKIIDTFRYKKIFNSQTGEVTNNQHLVSMVEDYWFSNRSGENGVSVDLLDETGNLGELRDIIYMQKKLYSSMGVPSTYATTIDDETSDFSVDADSVSQEEYRFFLKIQRLKNVYTEFFLHILKRDLIRTNVLTEEQFDIIKNDIKIYFDGENQIFDKIKKQNFLRNIDCFSQGKEFAGQIFSAKKLYKEAFGMTEQEVKDMFAEIEAEKKNPLYATFYNSSEEDSGGYY